MILSLRDLSKSFGGTVALKGVSLQCASGEVLGIVGENGAGKSTLIKILAGVHQADSGVLEWNGAEVCFKNPQQALQAGIATIHQELAYFEKLTVAENLLMGQEWPRSRWGGVDWTRFNEEAAAQLRACELEIDPTSLFHSLSPAQRQEAAIARALSQNAKLLILDEPTASLTEPEVVRLMGHLERLKREGVALLYVSHRLDEVMSLTDRVAVLRDGALVASYPTAEATIPRMVRDMVGRELGESSVRTQFAIPPNPLLEVRNFSRAGMFHDVSFTLHAGEVLALAGLVGAGRSELARAIYGLYRPEAGKRFLCGREWHPKSARAASDAGVVYIPEERKRQGFVLDHSTGSSMSIGFLRKLGRFGWVNAARERSEVRDASARFGVKTRGYEQPIGTLSGGNQQKALLARWLETDPQIIILDEPTRGVDVGAKAEIYKLIDQLAGQGKGILLISSDLPEVLALNDRVLILHRGRIVQELLRSEATQEKILMAASGLTSGALTNPR